MNKSFIAAFAATVACGLPAFAMAADIPGGTATKATMQVSDTFKTGDFEANNDSDWYRVQLKKGQDVALSCVQSLYMGCTLRDATGKVVATADTRDMYIDGGVEYRAPKAGLYFVEAKHNAASGESAPLRYDVRVSPDCRADKTTTCLIKPGDTKAKLIAYAKDVDWIAMRLAAGKTYTINSLDGTSEVALAVVDASGKVLANGVRQPGVSGLTIKDFKAAASGGYFLKMSYGGDGHTSYQVSLQAK